MAYYLDLFTRETWAAFRAHGSTVSGFRERQAKTARRITPGDIFLCYIVGVSRWCGLLEVTSRAYVDSSPVFADPDPYTIRFSVKSVVELDLERSIPIQDPAIWKKLSLTRGLETPVRGWAQHANLRASLREIGKQDGLIIAHALREQAALQRDYPLSSYELQKLRARASVRTPSRAVVVDIPGDLDEELSTEVASATTGLTSPAQPEEARSSHQMQAKLAAIGAQMGFRVWLPRNDRAAVEELMPPAARNLILSTLPLNYDDATLKTIENIDVLWMHNRSMARAFEVEHTTAIYSGLLRMADLLALQPNMDIRLHIVAPDDKRDKVMREIKRPVFALLDRGPLYESCSYISYSAVEELSAIKHLAHMNDTILEEYEELADDQ